MGRRGPAPEPTALLKLKGSKRVTRAREETEAAGPAGIPRKPAWLDRVAKTCWDQLVPLLSEMGVLTLIDVKALERYCRFYSRWRRAEKVIEEEGETFPIRDKKTGEISYVQQRPEVAIANQLAIRLARLEQEFGMTPSARTRIRIEPAKEGKSGGKERHFSAG